MIPLFVSFPQSKSRQPIELRFSIDDSIETIKNRLYRVTGWPPMYIQLALFRENVLLIDRMHDWGETTHLSAYEPRPYDCISVTCSDSTLVNAYEHQFQSVSIGDAVRAAEAGESTSIVKKFELTEEEYSRLPDNAAKWRARMFSPQERNQSQVKDSLSAMETNFRIGDRVIVTLTKKPPNVSANGNKATVHYVGTVHFASGTWIGVSYDDPIGKHNGTIDTKDYFQTKEKHGAFVRPDCVHLLYSNDDSSELMFCDSSDKDTSISLIEL